MSEIHDATTTLPAPGSTVPRPLGRRKLLTAGAALAAAIVPVAAQAAGNPDAILVRLCGDYIAAMDAFDANPSRLDAHEDPLWHKVERLEEQILATPTQSRAGLLAIARVASREALGHEHSAHYDPSDFDVCAADKWCERLTRDTLRLGGLS